MRKPHVPVRRCVVCREPADKQGLVRVVRLPDDGVELDPTGKAPGRGAYLCLRPSCQQDSRKWRKVAGSLKANMTSEQAAQLEQQLRALLSCRAEVIG